MGRKAARSPKKIAALRCQQTERLRDQFEALVAAMEAAKDPAAHAAVEKRARALIAVLKAMKDTYPSNPTREPDMPETFPETVDDDFEAPHGEDTGADFTPRFDALDVWQVVLERKLNRLTAAYRKRSASVGEDVPADRPPDC